MDKKKIILTIFIVVILLNTVACQPKSKEPLSRSAFMMDTVINLRIYDKTDEDIMNEAMDRLKEIEDRMSITLEDSDISLINKNAGIKPVQVHDDVYYVLEIAKYYANLSNGAYDPTIGPLVELWDVNDKEIERDTIPSDADIKKALELVDYNDLELMENNYVYLKREGMKLDLGGVAKGYAADEVKKIFKENGVESAIIDLGGNIYVMGDKGEGNPWRIGITNPFEPTGRFTGLLELIDSSVITSGDYERYFIYEGKKYHHILDSKTGYPSDSGIRGVSIVSEKGIDGDALSTTLFVLGLDKGLELVDKLEGIEAIFITSDKEVIVTDGLKDKFIMDNPEFKLINNEY